jgi:hypothetical protein
MSIEVYFILASLAIPVYFFSRWALKRFIQDEQKRKVATWIATVVLTPLVYVSIVVTVLLCVSYYPSREFDSQQWLADQEKRFEFSEDIIARKILIGKTKAEVRLLLGDEGNTDVSDHWTYYLGFRPQFINIDPDVLVVEFKDGVVVSVQQHGT